METEAKSMNVDDKKLEEGAAKKSDEGEELEGLAKQVGNVVSVPHRQPAGGRGSASTTRAMFRSIESTHGSQMAKGFPSGGTCGLCKRISKSITENVCDDCKDSMGVTQWHTSHLG